MEKVKNRTGLDKKFFEHLAPLVKDLGFVLYDSEYLTQQKLLRLYIMNEKTQTAQLDDCVHVDRSLSPFFESQEWIPEEITLEVGSPGVYRHVNSWQHFQWGLGQVHEVVITGALDTSHFSQTTKVLPKSLLSAKKFRGVVMEVSDNAVKIQLENCQVSLPWEQIKKAQLDPDFQQLMQNAAAQEKASGTQIINIEQGE
jgi:ribosome maturation factor RimP